MKPYHAADIIHIRRGSSLGPNSTNWRASMPKRKRDLTTSSGPKSSSSNPAGASKKQGLTGTGSDSANWRARKDASSSNPGHGPPGASSANQGPTRTGSDSANWRATNNNKRARGVNWNHEKKRRFWNGRRGGFSGCW